MIEETKELLKEKYGIKDELLNIYEKAIEDVKVIYEKYDDIREFNQLKVLKAFQDERISDIHFNMTTGYGYGDIGRDTLDRVYADIFNAEAALVRPHFVNGTHAIGAALFGNLRPGDKMLSICGTPYDTLHSIIGLNGKENMGSLIDFGVKYKKNDMIDDNIDLKALKEDLINDPSIRLIHIQRSTGYGWRRSLSIEKIGQVIKYIKNIKEDVMVFVDNCYGEFIETKEPTDVGADLIAGSLIKNIGGGIAPTGGYLAGKKQYVDNAAYRLTIPGIGGECGSTFGVTRLMYQGLFLAPHVSMEALKGAILCSRIMEIMGYQVMPKYNEDRTDIIQSIKFNDREKLIKFCKGIQYGSPVDSFAECEPWDMPGYEDKVIMAAGAFIQGSSIELSCDAPIREPYIAYLQGGLTFDHSKIGILIGTNNII